MAAKDVKDRESLERWLSGRPIEDARVVAAKAALISVPSLDTATRRLANADWLPPLLANAFRGPAVALLAANRSNLTAELAKASRDAYDAARATAKSAFSVASAAVKATESNRAAESQDFARGAYADASDAIAHAATDAVSVSSCAAYSAAAGMASSDAARAASGAVNSAVNSASEAGSVWDCVRTLAETFDKRIPRRVFAYAPLWPEATPEWIMERWQVLKREEDQGYCCSVSQQARDDERDSNERRYSSEDHNRSPLHLARQPSRRRTRTRARRRARSRRPTLLDRAT